MRAARAALCVVAAAFRIAPTAPQHSVLIIPPWDFAPHNFTALCVDATDKLHPVAPYNGYDAHAPNRRWLYAAVPHGQAPAAGWPVYISWSTDGFRPQDPATAKAWGASDDTAATLCGANLHWRQRHYALWGGWTVLAGCTVFAVLLHRVSTPTGKWFWREWRDGELRCCGGSPKSGAPTATSRLVTTAALLLPPDARTLSSSRPNATSQWGRSLSSLSWTSAPARRRRSANAPGTALRRARSV